MKIVGLAVALLVLAWAGWSLFPRAWNAGLALFGRTPANLNEIAASWPGHDPGLELAEIAPERLPLLREHKLALQEMATALQEMAQGFATLRNLDRFGSGNEDVARASRKLDRAAQKEASLAALEPQEKAALATLANLQLRFNAGITGHELTRLTRDSGIKGDFGKLADAIDQAQKPFVRDFPSDSPRPAVLLVMPRIDDPAQKQLILEQASALVEQAGAIVDYAGPKEFGWGTEGETSLLRLSPVCSAADCARRITFGKVRRVTGRRIELDGWGLRGFR